MTSKDRAKEFLLKLLQEGIISDEEAEEENKYNELIYSLEELNQKMHNDTKCKGQIKEIDFLQE